MSEEGLKELYYIAVAQGKVEDAKDLAKKLVALGESKELLDRFMTYGKDIEKHLSRLAGFFHAKNLTLAELCLDCMLLSWPALKPVASRVRELARAAAPSKERKENAREVGKLHALNEQFDRFIAVYATSASPPIAPAATRMFDILPDPLKNIMPNALAARAKRCREEVAAFLEYREEFGYDSQELATYAAECRRLYPELTDLIKKILCKATPDRRPHQLPTDSIHGPRGQFKISSFIFTKDTYLLAKTDRMFPAPSKIKTINTHPIFVLSTTDISMRSCPCSSSCQMPISNKQRHIKKGCILEDNQKHPPYTFDRDSYLVEKFAFTDLNPPQSRTSMDFLGLVPVCCIVQTKGS